MILCSKVRRYLSDKLIIHQKCVRPDLFDKAQVGCSFFPATLSQAILLVCSAYF